MRSFARGSDGLTEICEDDAKKVVIPLLTDTIRESLSEYVQNLQYGTTTLNTVIKQLIKGKDIDYQEPQKRPVILFGYKIYRHHLLLLSRWRLFSRSMKNVLI